MAKEQKLFEVFEIPIKSVTPLLMHKVSKRTLDKIEERQKGAGGTTKKRELRDPFREAWESAYHATQEQEDTIGHKEGNVYLFPIMAFKRACIEVAKDMKATKKFSGEFVKRNMQFYGDHDINFAKIKSDPPIVQRDYVKLGGATKVIDLRYRMRFDNWSAKIKIKVIKGVVSQDEIMEIINAAGQNVGIGDWRVNKCGVYGSFEI